MGVTITGSVTNGAAFARWIEQNSRRVISQQLRRQGELAGTLAKQISDRELKPSRVGSRKRGHASYRDSFDVEYTGFDDFASGHMEITVLNDARHAGWIEDGTGGHTISPRSRKGRLAWPARPFAEPGPPVFVGKPGQSVEHPGFEGYHICERAARQAIIERTRGRVLGHLRISITSS